MIPMMGDKAFETVSNNDVVATVASICCSTVPGSAVVPVSVPSGTPITPCSALSPMLDPVELTGRDLAGHPHGRTGKIHGRFPQDPAKRHHTANDEPARRFRGRAIQNTPDGRPGRGKGPVLNCPPGYRSVVAREAQVHAAVRRVEPARGDHLRPGVEVQP